MARDLIVFDMDGVLVDVSDSYREAIVQTVKEFTGRTVTREAIQEYKNAGGWNNDWALSQRIVEDFGVRVDYAAIVDAFNKIFLGNGSDGLISRERWISAPGSLEKLAKRFDFAIFTGRTRMEAGITLGKFAAAFRFDPIVADDDVRESKPSPEGLLRIRSANPERKLWYVGDTIDDARSARAAGIAFIGIAGPENPKRGEVVQILRHEGAMAVLDDINQLEGALPS